MQHRVAEFCDCFCLYNRTRFFNFPLVAPKSTRVARVLERYYDLPAIFNSFSIHLGLTLNEKYYFQHIKDFHFFRKLPFVASWSLTSLPSRVGAGLITLVITNSSTNIRLVVVPVPTSAANGVPSSCVVTVPTSSMVGWRARRLLNSSAKNFPRRHWEVTSQTSWQDERPP